ncbi:hypothetical protein AB5I41_10925 [Sphingomonas sp. MMS24-JH45]
MTIEIAGGEPERAAVQPEAAGLRKWVAAERPVQVLRRRDGAAIPDIAALHGLRLALPNRSHGVPLSEAIARRFDRLGVVRVFPPEADGPALMRHAAVDGLCGGGSGLVRCAAGVAGIGMRWRGWISRRG